MEKESQFVCAARNFEKQYENPSYAQFMNWADEYSWTVTGKFRPKQKRNLGDDVGFCLERLGMLGNYAESVEEIVRFFRLSNRSLHKQLEKLEKIARDIDDEFLLERLTTLTKSLAKS